LGESARRIGVLGGTLDPVHHGHLFAAEEVWARYGLDQVLFIPCGHAPHKDARGITAAEHRLEMCQLATATNLCCPAGPPQTTEFQVLSAEELRVVQVIPSVEVITRLPVPALATATNFS